MQNPEVVIVPLLILCATYVIKTISDNRLRRQLIEKSTDITGLDLNLPGNREAAAPASLKWGIVMIAVGTAFFAGTFFSYEVRDEITLSLMLMAGGLGLICYYFLARKYFDAADS